MNKPNRPTSTETLKNELEAFAVVLDHCGSAVPTIDSTSAARPQARTITRVHLLCHSGTQRQTAEHTGTGQRATSLAFTRAYYNRYKEHSRKTCGNSPADASERSGTRVDGGLVMSVLPAGKKTLAVVPLVAVWLNGWLRSSEMMGVDGKMYYAHLSELPPPPGRLTPMGGT